MLRAAQDITPLNYCVNSAIVPLYNGETAPKAIRGTILVIYQVQIISGFVTKSSSPDIRTLIIPRSFSIFLSYLFELGSHTINNSLSWRIPIGLQMVWGLILLSGMFFLPESPCVPSLKLSSYVHRRSLLLLADTFSVLDEVMKPARSLRNSTEFLKTTLLLLKLSRNSILPLEQKMRAGERLGWNASLQGMQCGVEQ